MSVTLICWPLRRKTTVTLCARMTRDKRGNVQRKKETVVWKRGVDDTGARQKNGDGGEWTYTDSHRYDTSSFHLLPLGPRRLPETSFSGERSTSLLSTCQTISSRCQAIREVPTMSAVAKHICKSHARSELSLSIERKICGMYGVHALLSQK